MLTHSEAIACDLAAIGATSVLESLLAAQKRVIARVTAERDAALVVVAKLELFNAGLAERVAAQAELLAKRAEKTPR